MNANLSQVVQFVSARSMPIVEEVEVKTASLSDASDVPASPFKPAGINDRGMAVAGQGKELTKRKDGRAIPT